MAPDIKKKFGKRLRALREERGWSQVEMADLFAMNRGYLSELETGKRDPSLSVLHNLAVGFDISVSELLRGL